jgi:hypothetical protein
LILSRASIVLPGSSKALIKIDQIIISMNFFIVRCLLCLTSIRSELPGTAPIIGSVNFSCRGLKGQNKLQDLHPFGLAGACPTVARRQQMRL